MGRFVLCVLVVAIGVLRAACSYNPPSACGSIRTPAGIRCALGKAVKAEKTKAEVKTVFEEPGGLNIQHGLSCGKAADGATSSTLGSRLDERVAIPPKYDATVILNGWRTEYLSKDHHMLGLAVMISNIAVDSTRNRLNWTAAGVIGDHNGDDSYEWCYRYTVLAWPKGAKDFDITIAHDGKEHDLFFLAEEKNPLGAVRRTFGSHPDLPTTRARGPLLAGFGMSWSDDDHHLLQLGLDHGGGIAVKNGTLTWQTQTLLKDNKRSRGYAAAEVVSIIGGRSVAFWQPPKPQKKPGFIPTIAKPQLWNDFRLVPRDPKSTPGANLGHKLHVFQTTVKDVPFDYAIPMLTGWDVGDAYEDRHVRAIEASIADFSFEKDPATQKLTLRYTIQGGFKDQDTIPADHVDFEVTVLGLKRALGAANLPVDLSQLQELRPLEPPTQPTCNGKKATIVGTAGDDRLEGTDGADVIVGLAGKDEIRGRSGDDMLCGNEGDDKIDGGGGTDACDGGLGLNDLSGCES